MRSVEALPLSIDQKTRDVGRVPFRNGSTEALAGRGLRPSTPVHAAEGVEDVVADSVESFLRERGRVSADDARFSRTTNLWEDGYVDSIGVVELIGYIETTFELSLPDEVLFDPDFTSIDGIARIVHKLHALHGTHAP